MDLPHPPAVLNSFEHHCHAVRVPLYVATRSRHDLDAFGKLLRFSGRTVEIQNYIDDTGVQLADVVVGFADLRGMSLEEVAALPEPFDFYCWDLYSEVGRWFEADPERQKLRRETLHQLEIGQGERAELGRFVARRIVGRHLATMRRLGDCSETLRTARP